MAGLAGPLLIIQHAERTEFPAPAKGTLHKSNVRNGTKMIQTWPLWAGYSEKALGSAH